VKGWKISTQLESRKKCPWKTEQNEEMSELNLTRKEISEIYISIIRVLLGNFIDHRQPTSRVDTGPFRPHI